MAVNKLTAPSYINKGIGPPKGLRITESSRTRLIGFGGSVNRDVQLNKKVGGAWCYDPVRIMFAPMLIADVQVPGFLYKNVDRGISGPRK